MKNWIDNIENKKAKYTKSNEIYYEFVKKIQDKQYIIIKNTTDMVEKKIANKIIRVNYEGWCSGSKRTHLQYLFTELIIMHNDFPKFKNELGKIISIIYKLGSKYKCILIVPNVIPWRMA